MKKTYYSAMAYTILGLLSGVFYREVTKAEEFSGDTQLSVLHTHLLVLGTLTFLLVLLLDKNFPMSHTKVFNWFFRVYNAGLLVTVAMMATHGTMTVFGTTEISPAVSGIAGLGHLLLTAGLVLLFVALGRAIPNRARTASGRGLPVDQSNPGGRSPAQR